VNDVLRWSWLLFKLAVLLQLSASLSEFAYQGF
jgi:hypothetical protein